MKDVKNVWLLELKAKKNNFSLNICNFTYIYSSTAIAFTAL